MTVEFSSQGWIENMQYLSMLGTSRTALPRNHVQLMPAADESLLYPHHPTPTQPDTIVCSSQGSHYKGLQIPKM